MTTTQTKETAQAIDSIVMWECCDDEYGGPFNPTGIMTEDKADAVERLKDLRETNPDTYLVKVVMMRCSQEEEQIES